MQENYHETDGQDSPGPICFPLSGKSGRPGNGLLRGKYYLSREARSQDVGFGLELPHKRVLRGPGAARLRGETLIAAARVSFFHAKQK